MIWLVVFIIVFCGTSFLVVLGRLGQFSLPACPRYISVCPDHIWIPATVRDYFQEVRDQLVALGFELQATVIHPRVQPGATSYMMFLRAKNSADNAMCGAIRAGPPARNLAGFIVQFETRLTDGSQLITDNAPVAHVYARDPRKRLMRIPGWADIASLYQLHKKAVLLSGVNACQDTRNLSVVESLEEDFKSDMEANVREGVLRESKDGQWYEFPASQVPRLVYVAILGSIRIRRRAKGFLKSVGAPTTYAQVGSASFTTNKSDTASTPHRSNWKSHLRMILELACIAAFMFLLVSRQYLGWVRIDMLVICLSVFYLLSKRVSAFKRRVKFCKACGHDLAGGARCHLCGEWKCVKCGYDLFTNRTGRCPECGATYCLTCGRAILGIDSQDCKCAQTAVIPAFAREGTIP